MAKEMKTRSYRVCGQKIFTIQIHANLDNDLVYTNMSAKKGVTDTGKNGIKHF